MGIEELLSGGALLDLHKEAWSADLSSRIVSLLIKDENYEEAAKILVERTIGARECLVLGANIPLEDPSLRSVIEDSVKRLDSAVLKEILRDEALPVRVKIPASRAASDWKD